MEKHPIVGIDLDNTLISYDKLFHHLALEQELISPDLPANKTVVRDYLRSIGKEPAWTALQGLAYGPRLSEAEAFPGALDFLREGLRRKWPLFVVSHKTQYPIVGERFDLHQAARAWFESQAIHDGIGLPRENLWFETTKAAKIARIQALGCQIFIDDLPELLLDPSFPSGIRRILFAPLGSDLTDLPPRVSVVQSWTEITGLLSRELV